MEKKNIGNRYFQSIQVWARAWFSVGCGNFTCSGLNSWFVLFIIRFFIHFISLTPACGPVSVWPLCALSPWSQFNSASYALVLVSILLTSFFIFLVPHLMWFVFGFASPVLFFLTLFNCVPWCFNLPNYLVCIWISTFLFLLQFSSCCVLSVFFSSPDIFLDYLCLCFFPQFTALKLSSLVHFPISQVLHLGPLPACHTATCHRSLIPVWTQWTQLRVARGSSFFPVKNVVVGV